MNRFAMTLAASFAFVAPAALAHTGSLPIAGFWSGFFHPLSGPDHLLAMLGTGFWAAVGQPRRAWLVTGVFSAVMVLGGVFGALGLPLVGMESGMALSVLLVGTLAAAMARPAMPLALALVAAFGLFHGYAHGSEMADGSGFANYAAGFTAASLLLQGAGVALGRALLRVPVVYRGAGGLVGASGCWLLAQAF